MVPGSGTVPNLPKTQCLRFRFKKNILYLYKYMLIYETYFQQCISVAECCHNYTGYKALSTLCFSCSCLWSDNIKLTWIYFDVPALVKKKIMFSRTSNYSDTIVTFNTGIFDIWSVFETDLRCVCFAQDLVVCKVTRPPQKEEKHASKRLYYILLTLC